MGWEREAIAARPPHHRPDGRFRNPWPEAEGEDEIRGRIREVVWTWITSSLPPDPGAGDLPMAEPDPAHPAAGAGEVRITWVGHATHLIQLPGLNLVTDPMWSARASPVPFLGTKRFVAAAPEVDDLPRLDGVLLSHDHFDHLDRASVVRLRKRFGAELPWYTPLGYGDWFGSVGVENVVEMDWWDEREMVGTGYRIVCTPARHWTRRTLWGTNRRLWSSWAIVPEREGGPRVYFGADSAYASHFRAIGSRLGPFHASILPIGAYDPRWFMKVSHMNPEEAVRAYADLGGEGAFLPSHWGTFRLTFEDPLEPPRRLRQEWSRRGLPSERLHVPRHGGTVTIRRGLDGGRDSP